MVHQIGGGEAKRGRQVYLALYQTLDRGDARPLYREYEPDYFDLIIVDECHRGSARESSQWREILAYFKPATQIGMTATPISRKDAYTYGYFGEPVYEYSLAQGIDDGFLAPYRVRRVRMNVDMTGFRPEPGQLDKYGNEIPDKLYTPMQYERVLVILERTEEAARYITEYLRSTDPMAKTVVFCENNDHAHRVRKAINNANQDLVRQIPNYVVRITDDDGPHGRALLDDFRRNDTDEPVIAVTSRLLTTGVDMPMVRNIVIFRRIASMPEFKQTIGRGTRLCLEAGKGSFDIVDFVEATVLFNDPEFDGPPLRIQRDDTDEQGHLVGSEVEQEQDEAVAEPDLEYQEQDSGSFATAADADSAGVVDDPDQLDLIRANGKRYYVEGVEVYKWGEAFYQLESDGRRMRLTTYRQFVHNRVLELDLSPSSLRARWAAATSRRALIDALERSGLEMDELVEKLQNPDVDPVDLLLNAAWGLPLVSRDERAVRVRREHREFFEAFTPEAQQVLEAMLDKFEAHGSTELTPRALLVPPLSTMGSIADLTARFGGPDQLHDALDDLGRRLFEVA